MIVSGVQQIGIGVRDVHEAWAWYRKVLGQDIPIFEEKAEANLMLPYTGGKPHSRHAVLAINKNGGGGFEIWQYTSRTPEGPKFDIRLGDLGLYIAKVKSRNVRSSYTHMKSHDVEILGDVSKTPDGREHYFFKDPYGNLFEVVAFDDFLDQGVLETGGAIGFVIGVSEIERSHNYYKDVLGYDMVLYKGEGQRKDFYALPRGNANYRYIGLRRSEESLGAFGPLLGPTEIELVEWVEGKGEKIFKDRFWGDLGFIHLCYDINGMDELRTICADKGYPFTVDSSESFDMGEAAGHFAYIEDPDGTLIEFVETHKIPILKKIGWYLDLRKRNPKKPLSKWLFKAMFLNRKKD